MKKLRIIGGVLLLMSSILFGCSHSVEQFKGLDHAKRVDLQSGSTGEVVEITDTETISKIVDMMSLEFGEGKKNNNSTGWSYTVKWYDTEGVQISSIVIMSDKTIQIDDYFYTASQGTMDLSLLEKIIKSVQHDEDIEDSGSGIV